MKAASEGALKGVVGYTEEPLFPPTLWVRPALAFLMQRQASCLTILLKLCAWYDNEWGYSNKLLEMVRVIAK